MVVQVFVPQRQPVHPLGHQFLHPVVEPRGVPMVPKAGRELGDDPRALLHLAPQQPAGVRGDRPAIKLTPYFAANQQVAEKLFGDVILSVAKNLVLKRVNNLRDSSSPAAPQNDRLAAFFSNLLGDEIPEILGYTV